MVRSSNIIAYLDYNQTKRRKEKEGLNVNYLYNFIFEVYVQFVK
jgi:hypothetical protein